MREEMITLMNSYRESRIEEKERHIFLDCAATLRRLLRRRVRDQPPQVQQIFPNIADLYSHHLVFRQVFDTPLTEAERDTVTEGDFAQALGGIDDIVRQWRDTHMENLLQRLPLIESHTPISGTRTSHPELALASLDAARVSPGSMESPGSATHGTCHSEARDPFARLRLTTSLFTCQCSTISMRSFHYDNIIAHSCGKRQLSLSVTSTVSDSPKWKILGELPLDQLMERSIKFDDIGSAIAARIIQECGLDPLTATPEDMDTLDVRFTCSCDRCYSTFMASSLVLIGARRYVPPITPSGQGSS